MTIENNSPSKAVKSNKVEQREIFPSDPDPLFEGYFDEIRNKSFRQRTQEDVEKVVSLELSAPPITQLTKEELEKLREYLIKEAQSYQRKVNTTYNWFVTNPIYLLEDVAIMEKLRSQNMWSGSSYPTFLVGSETHDSQIDDIIKTLNIPTLQPEVLINLLKDPEIIHLCLIKGDSHNYAGLIAEGSRTLYPYNQYQEDFGDYYGYISAEDFRNKLERIKQRSKKQTLTMLDIGGNVGKALLDAKKVDPTLKTINMTLVSLPAIGGDIIARRPAEYMPVAFEGKIDLIESNVAFRYFVFPDIALRNAVKALSIGGETNLSFTNERSPLDREEMLGRMTKVFTWLRELEQKDYIEVSRMGNPNWDPFLVEGAYLGKQLQIIKKKSTVGI